jgi:flagellar hook protein FlgE
MNSISAFQSGVAGVQNGVYGASQNANQIARADQLSSQQLTQELVSLNANERQVQAAAKVIETSNEMIGSLLDIKV